MINYKTLKQVNYRKMTGKYERMGKRERTEEVEIEVHFAAMKIQQVTE